MEVDINGKKYRLKEFNESQNSNIYTKLLQMAASSGIFKSGHPLKEPDGLEYTNFVSEFRLIQQKKSNLSRNQREWIVRMFYKYYEKITE